MIKKKFRGVFNLIEESLNVHRYTIQDISLNDLH